jgi:hypothetical protein
VNSINNGIKISSVLTEEDTHLSQDSKKFAMNYYQPRIFLAPPLVGKRFDTEFLAVRHKNVINAEQS